MILLDDENTEMEARWYIYNCKWDLLFKFAMHMAIVGLSPFSRKGKYSSGAENSNRDTLASEA